MAGNLLCPFVSKIKKNRELFVVYTILLLFLVVPGNFVQGYFTLNNFMNILRLSSILGIVALAQTLVMLTGGIDLSLGALLTCMNIVAAGMIANRPERVFPVVSFCLLFGIIVGLINGSITVKLKVPPMITTLGMMTALEGITYIYTGGFPRGGIPPGFRQLGIGYIGKYLPFPVVIWVVCLGIVFMLSRRSTYGRKIYAIGANQQMAMASGINCDKILIITYAISGLLGALGGLVLAAYVGTPTVCFGFGIEYTMGSIIAVILGGTSLTGGRGNVIGTVGGVLILRLLFGLLTMMNISKGGQNIVQGLILLTISVIYAKTVSSKKVTV